MGSVFTRMRMEKFTRVTGEKTLDMAKALKLKRMELFTRVTGKMINFMALGH
jgi:hypothetical protein